MAHPACQFVSGWAQAVGVGAVATHRVGNEVAVGNGCAQAAVDVVGRSALYLDLLSNRTCCGTGCAGGSTSDVGEVDSVGAGIAG